MIFHDFFVLKIIKLKKKHAKIIKLKKKACKNYKVFHLSNLVHFRLFWLVFQNYFPKNLQNR